MFAYHLGDLDDFYFPHCQWAADYHQRARIEEAVLIYSGGKIPTVMAFGLTDRFEDFVSELSDLLPQKFHCHYQKRIHTILLSSYSEQYRGTLWKMKLTNKSKAQSFNRPGMEHVIQMKESHADELEKMYQSAYPDGFFDPKMLQSGYYFGYSHQGKIVSCGGIHVNSEEFSLAVMGSIATLPEFRGRGYATLVTARLLKELMPKRDLIMLNVDGKNEPAVKCYSNLGFQKTHEYEEGMFTLKK